MMRKFYYIDTAKKTKRQITIAAYVMIAFCVILAVGFPFAKAYSSSMLADQAAAGCAKTCTEQFAYYFTDNNKMYDWCVGSVTEDNLTALPGVFSGFDTAYSAFKGIGFVLAMSVALGRLFQKMERGQDGIQIIMMSLMSICVTGIIIMNLDKICGAIGLMGKYIIQYFIYNEDTDAGKEFANALKEAYLGAEEGATLFNIKGFLSLLAPSLANTVACYTIHILIISKLLEIALLRMFAPLAVYDVYDEGLRSSGAMYLKRLLASFLSLAMSAFVASMVGFVPAMFIANTYQEAGGAALGVVGGVAAIRGNGIITAATTVLQQLLQKQAENGSDTYATASSVAPFIPTIANFTCVKMIKNTDEYAKSVLGVR